MPTLLTDRRRFLAFFSSMGLSSTLLPGVVWAMGQEKSSLSPDQLDAALKLSGLSLDEPKRQLMLSSLNEQLDAARTIRELNLPNSLAPAFSFDPVLPGVTTWDTVKRPLKVSPARPPRVGNDLEELATRSGRDALLTQQGENDWPNFFRAAQLMPAVEYINANRARVLAMEGMARTFADVDASWRPREIRRCG